MRHWAPNQEPLVLLKCGCITIRWPVLHILGDGKWRDKVPCDDHGWQTFKIATWEELEKRAWNNIQDRLF